MRSNASLGICVGLALLVGGCTSGTNDTTTTSTIGPLDFLELLPDGQTCETDTREAEDDSTLIRAIADEAIELLVDIRDAAQILAFEALGELTEDERALIAVETIVESIDTSIDGATEGLQEARDCSDIGTSLSGIREWLEWLEQPVVPPPTTTTTTVATTTTTSPSTATTEDPWSVDYPLEAETVDDLPSVLTDRIGAPEPNPVLSVEGPEDVHRWVDEWLGWFSWVNANPADGVEALDHAVIPVSTFYEETTAALEARLDEGTRLLGFAFVPVEVSATFDEFFERRELLRLVVVASDTIPRYIVDEAGSVVTIHEPLGGETTIRLVLRYREGEGEWVLENLEVVS